jgi:hypothetical protein
MFSGPYLKITPSEENALLRLHGEHECHVRIDDARINRLGLWPDGVGRRGACLALALVGARPCFVQLRDIVSIER